LSITSVFNALSLLGGIFTSGLCRFLETFIFRAGLIEKFFSCVSKAYCLFTALGATAQLALFFVIIM